MKSVLGVLSPAHIFWTLIADRPELVGKDPAGNRYYQAQSRAGYKRETRRVIYRGDPETTRVPPEWHGWLHHQTDEAPLPGKLSFRQNWQKPHSNNMTGTDMAYRPHEKIGKEKAATCCRGYEAWKPGHKRRL